MSISINYSVDKELYHTSATEHNIFLVTTEYQCRNELLAHVLIGKTLGIQLNDRLSDLLEGAIVQNEQFFLKKTYNHDNPKVITRSTFYDKMKRFNMEQTTVSREILEDYTYTDKNGLLGHVKILINDSFDATTATIDFEDAEQYESFICPDWLTKAEG